MNVPEAIAALEGLPRALPELPGRVRLVLEDPVPRLVIDNPTARNALTVGMMIDLARAVDALGHSEVAGLVIMAEGKAFCAGGHLDQVMAAIAGPAEARVMCDAMTAVLDGLLALPILTVAAIDGLAIGGGAELATAADFRIFGPAGRFRLVQASLGIASGWGGVGRLVRHVGRGTALRLAATSRMVDGPDAVALGLAEPVDAADGALAAAERFLAELSAPPAAIRAAKIQVAAAETGDHAAAAAAFAALWGGPTHRAALARLGWGS